MPDIDHDGFREEVAGLLKEADLERTVKFHWEGGDYECMLLGLQQTFLSAKIPPGPIYEPGVWLLVDIPGGDSGPQWLDLDSGESIWVSHA